MESTTRQLDVVTLDFAHALPRGIEESGMEGHGRNAEDVLPFDGATLGGRGFVGGGSALGQHRREFSGVDVSHVEGDHGFAGHCGDDTGLARHRTDSRDSIVAVADLGGCEGEARRGAETVAAHGHRHGAGVGRLTAEDQTLTLDPLGAGDGADAAAHRLEHRTLFDVDLHVRLDVRESGPSSVESIDVDSVLGEDVDESIALFVGQSAENLHIDCSGHRGRTEERSTEASTLFVGPIHEGHADRGSSRRGE